MFIFIMKKKKHKKKQQLKMVDGWCHWECDGDGFERLESDRGLEMSC